MIYFNTEFEILKTVKKCCFFDDILFFYRLFTYKLKKHLFFY